MRTCVRALALLTLVVVSACNRSRSQGTGVVGVTTLCAMRSDPARDLVYLGDSVVGRMVALSATSGNDVAEIFLGNTLGGIAQDHCFDHIFVSVTGGLRIDVIDPDSFFRTSTLRLGTSTFAISNGAPGHLLVVTGRALVDLDLARMTATTLKPGASIQSFLCTSRDEMRAWLVESGSGEIVVTTFDLTDLSVAGVTTSPGQLQGNAVGVASSFAGDRLYVASDGADGVYVVDGATLLPIGTIDVGPGLTAMTINPTGTRMNFAQGGDVVHGASLDVGNPPGRTIIAAADVRERGLLVASNGLSLVTHTVDDQVQLYGLFDLRMDSVAAARQGETFSVTLDGSPRADWFLFMSLEPGYLYLDPPSLPDPRFFDLSISNGPVLLMAGTFDSFGHTEFSGTVPGGFAEHVDFVIQAAELPRRGRAFVEIGNPIAVRFLGSDCR